MIQTRKQMKFIDEYVKNPLKTGREIVIACGYSDKGASVTANRLLKDIKIKEEIDRRLRVRAEELGITEDNITNLFWKEARQSAKASDRIQALAHLARIKGLMKDTPTQSIAIFNSTQAIDTQVDTTASMLT